MQEPRQRVGELAEGRRVIGTIEGEPLVQQPVRAKQFLDAVRHVGARHDDHLMAAVVHRHRHRVAMTRTEAFHAIA